ncbi:MAG: hypothetical protein ABIJ09_16830 [Pseudomonadota bacterium]
MTDTQTVEYANLWAIHSEKEGRPAMCGWARSEAEAAKEMERMKKADPEPGTTSYWVLRMTRHEVDQFKQTGFIPADA